MKTPEQYYAELRLLGYDNYTKKYDNKTPDVTVRYTFPFPIHGSESLRRNEVVFWEKLTTPKDLTDNWDNLSRCSKRRIKGCSDNQVKYTSSAHRELLLAHLVKNHEGVTAEILNNEPSS